MATSFKPGNKKKSNRERAVVLSLGAAVLACVLLFSLFGPARDPDNPAPTTYNSGTHGIKAAYLLAGELGYEARRLEQPPEAWKNLDPTRTTLVLTEPVLPVKSLAATQAGIADFLTHGGRVVATGMTGATLLPKGMATAGTNMYKALCYTEPEGAGELARAGQLQTDDTARWTTEGPEYHVEQRCGTDPVVVRYAYGKGEAIWWASPMPVSNGGLKNDANLKLVLASFGAPQGRTVIFDEYLHAQRESISDLLAGLPWWPLAGQALAVAILLVFSRGRRNGPLRMPLAVPRTSPLEFAESMGRLYSRAGATSAPLEAARARMIHFLGTYCALSHDVLRQSPQAIGEAVGARFGGDWSTLARHLEEADLGYGDQPPPAAALRLVQALAADEQALRAQQSRHATSSSSA